MKRTLVTLLVMLVLFYGFFLQKSWGVSPNTTTDLQNLTEIDRVSRLIDYLVEDMSIRKPIFKGKKAVLIREKSEKSQFPSAFYRAVEAKIMSAVRKRKLMDFILVKEPDKPSLVIEQRGDRLVIDRPRHTLTLREAVLENGGDLIFYYNLSYFKRFFYLSFVISDAVTNKILYSYQISEKDLSPKPEMIPLIKVFDYCFVNIGPMLGYRFSPYKLASTNSTLSTEETNYLVGFQIGFHYPMSYYPRLLIGVEYNLYKSLNKPSIIGHAFLLDFNFQLNRYIPPLYDTQTDRLIKVRNKRLIAIGVSFGPYLVGGSNWKERETLFMVSPYVDLGLGRSFNVQLGLTWTNKGTLMASPAGSYAGYDKPVDISGFSLFLKINYKFNFLVKER